MASSDDTESIADYLATIPKGGAKNILDNLESGHRRLDDQGLEIISNVRVRLAGWSGGRSPKIADEMSDIRIVQNLESPLVEWRDRLDEASNNKELDLDQHGLNDEHHRWLEHFSKKGGHVSRMPTLKVREIMKTGAIAIVELQVRKGVWVAVASVSSLMDVPFSKEESELDEIWPMYDARDLTLPSIEMEEMIPNLHNYMLIVRSTVLETLSSEQLKLKEPLPEELEGKSMRRFGFAALGKIHILHAMKEVCKKTGLTMNIGSLRHPKEQGISMANEPSTQHNSWVNGWGWKKEYHDCVIPKDGKKRPKNVNMFWLARRATIESGIEKFLASNGILTGKGWDSSRVRKSMENFAKCMQKDVDSGRKQRMKYNYCAKSS